MTEEQRKKHGELREKARGLLVKRGLVPEKRTEPEATTVFATDATTDTSSTKKARKDRAPTGPTGKPEAEPPTAGTEGAPEATPAWMGGVPAEQYLATMEEDSDNEVPMTPPTPGYAKKVPSRSPTPIPGPSSSDL